MSNVKNTDRPSRATPETETIACEVCMKEIPRSVAHSHEGPDYVLHFCGSGCFDRWREGLEADEG